MRLRCAALLLTALALAGCAQQQPRDTAVVSEAPPAGELLPRARVSPPVEPAPPRDLWERIRRQLRFHTLHNSDIATAREYYLGQPRYLELIAPRAQRYLYYLVEEVESRGLPIELALLPMVESALNPFAYSQQRAAGLWQIMPGTADDLGMRRDWWYDARLDLRDSTRHALNHLEALNADFDGDWLLTLAAYNSGKARVRRAIERNRRDGRPTDFWSLDLPRETRRYVPRLVALSTLIAFDRALEIELPPVANEAAFRAVATGGQIEMLRVAELADLDLLELRRYNPGQLRWATAPGGVDTLLLPSDRATRAEEALVRLPASERVTWQHYRIRRGDSLIRIARRFDTSVGLLRSVNNLRGNFIRAGDTLMIPDSTAWRDSLAMVSGGTSGVRRGYTVRRGDSLYRIARRFDVSIDDLVTWNELDRGSYLQPGQLLTLYIDGG
ncbi:MAG: LysM peptidoglycan-binding domain-containing protein [Halieaceae bacterium]|jgi:membrane-bound lytic murein transglycosylase D|nr:LysM peptidoglycan-binding domain-containing protein [Halieaceae bacterium]